MIFFIALLRFALLPIQNELFKQGKTFSDELNLMCQKESIPKEPLFQTEAYLSIDSIIMK